MHKRIWTPSNVCNDGCQCSAYGALHWDTIEIFVEIIIMIRKCVCVFFHLHKHFWPEGF